jgi:hypothetical protein
MPSEFRFRRSSKKRSREVSFLVSRRAVEAEIGKAAKA